MLAPVTTMSETPTEWSRLLARYKALPAEATQRERAVLELDLLGVAQRTVLVGQKVTKRQWLADTLGVGRYEIECNLGLLAFGQVATPFWERVNGDMTMRTALDLMRKARDRADVDGCGVQSAVERTLADYDALPNVCSLPNGKVIRKKSNVALPREAELPRVEAKSKPKKKKRSAESDPLDSVDDARAFWSGLRLTISDHFRVRLQGLDSMAVDQAWRALEVDLKTTLEYHMDKLHRMRRSHADRTTLASRGKILHAYRTLLLEAPKPSEAIDIKRVKSQFRKLTSIYHPDKSGTEETREQYEAVVKAYRTLEEAHEIQTLNGGK